MPTYEYACRDCSQHVEVVQSMHDAPLTACPHCGGNLRKVFSPIGVVFKGSGFYRNDSRSAKAPAAAESSTAGTAADSSPTPGSGKDAGTGKDAGAGKDAGTSSAASTAASQTAPSRDGGKKSQSASTPAEPTSSTKKSA